MTMLPESWAGEHEGGAVPRVPGGRDRAVADRRAASGRVAAVALFLTRIGRPASFGVPDWDVKVASESHNAPGDPSDAWAFSVLSGDGALFLQGAGVGRYVNGVLLQSFEGHDVEGPLMGGRQYHERRRAVAVSLQPVRRGYTPAVARRETGKSELRPRGAEVVAYAPLMLEELRGNHGADRVASQILSPGSTTSVPVEAGERLDTALLQLPTQHVAILHHSSIAPQPPLRSIVDERIGCRRTGRRQALAWPAPRRALGTVAAAHECTPSVPDPFKDGRSE